MTQIRRIRMGSKKKKYKPKRNDSPKGLEGLMSIRSSLPKANPPDSKQEVQVHNKPKKNKNKRFDHASQPVPKHEEKAVIISQKNINKGLDPDSQSVSKQKKQTVASRQEEHAINTSQKNTNKSFHRGPRNKTHHRQESGGNYRIKQNFNNRYPLPKDVLQCLEKIENHISNVSLVLHRFVPWSSGWKIEKNEVWQDIEKKANAIIRQDKQAHRFLERQKNLLNTLKSTLGENEVIEIKAENLSKLSIGFGNPTPLETGLTLHRLYGLPCIPGTSIKGMCRSWKIDDFMDILQLPVLDAKKIEKIHKNKKKTPYELLEKLLYDNSFVHDENVKDIDKINAQFWKNVCKSVGESSVSKQVHLSTIHSEARQFSRIFGRQDAEGEICFFDAFPTDTKQDLFSIDVINVHFQQYYDNNNKPPADYLSPVPNYFLTVSSGTIFRLIILKRKVLNKSNKSLLKIATQWLTNALEENGLGSKTAVGYGEMRIL